MEISILSRIIHLQNHDLLKRIADDHFTNESDKGDFIKKYHKKGYSSIHNVKKMNLELYQKKCEKLMR